MGFIFNTNKIKSFFKKSKQLLVDGCCETSECCTDFGCNYIIEYATFFLGVAGQWTTVDPSGVIDGSLFGNVRNADLRIRVTAVNADVEISNISILGNVLDWTFTTPITITNGTNDIIAIYNNLFNPAQQIISFTNDCDNQQTLLTINFV